MVDFKSLTSKLKSLSIEGIKKKLAEPIGDGIRSTYKIISIAGETLALSDTGIDPTEKMFHSKADFERLYVPDDIKEHQQDLEEILTRMFPLTSAQSKQDILPPENEEEFNLVRQSLYYRMALLRDEILKDSSNSVDIREKISRFDRLNKLLDSLESKFQKKRTQTYFALTTTSSAPVTEEPKIDMDDETVDDLLRKFGLVLLQSQHQLPGFHFPVPPNQIVRQVQSVLLPDEEDFINEVEKEGEVQGSIQDVLTPDEKETRLLKSLRHAILTKIGSLIPTTSKDTADAFNEDLLDESLPFQESLENFLTSLFSVLSQFESDVRQAQQLQDTMDEILDRLKDEKAKCEQQLQELQGKVAKATKSATDATSQQGLDRKAFEAGAMKLRKEIEDKAAQIRILEAQLTGIREQLRLKETAAEAVGALTPEVERLREDVRVKAETIAALQAKDAEVEPLRARIAELESKETITKEEQKSLALAEAELERVSGEKQTLEEQLRDYGENLEQLQELVARIPGPPPTEGVSPFQLLKERILSVLPPAHFIPTELEIQSDQKNYTCTFLQTLLQLFQTYFDSEEGQQLSSQLTEHVDYLHRDASMDTVVKNLLMYLQYANNPTNQAGFLPPFQRYEPLKSLEESANSVFFKVQPDSRETVTPLSEKLAGVNSPSYPILFFLYLLALRDWVNCIDLSSRPTKCPIPARLQRTVKCP